MLSLDIKSKLLTCDSKIVEHVFDIIVAYNKISEPINDQEIYDMLLILGSFFNNIKHVEYALDHGANVESKYNFNKRAIPANRRMTENICGPAIKYAGEDILILLMTNGANIYSFDFEGKSIFHHQLPYYFTFVDELDDKYLERCSFVLNSERCSYKELERKMGYTIPKEKLLFKTEEILTINREFRDLVRFQQIYYKPNVEKLKELNVTKRYRTMSWRECENVMTYIKLGVKYDISLMKYVYRDGELFDHLLKELTDEQKDEKIVSLITSWYDCTYEAMLAKLFESGGKLHDKKILEGAHRDIQKLCKLYILAEKLVDYPEYICLRGTFDPYYYYRCGLFNDHPIYCGSEGYIYMNNRGYYVVNSKIDPDILIVKARCYSEDLKIFKKFKYYSTSSSAYATFAGNIEFDGLIYKLSGYTYKRGSKMIKKYGHLSVHRDTDTVDYERSFLGCFIHAPYNDKEDDLTYHTYTIVELEYPKEQKPYLDYDSFEKLTTIDKQKFQIFNVDLSKFNSNFIHQNERRR